MDIKMPGNYHRFSVLTLLLLFASVGLAQPKSSEPRPEGYYAQQRQLKNWWDEPTAAGILKLESEQVAKLAKLQDEFSEVFKANAATLKEQDKSLGEAILAGNKENVDRIKKSMMEVISAAALKQIEFKVAGLAVLNEQQLAEIATSYPDVLDKKWGLRTKGMTRGKGARGEKDKKNKEEKEK